jgi:hypothetical protein
MISPHLIDYKVEGCDNIKFDCNKTIYVLFLQVFPNVITVSNKKGISSPVFHAATSACQNTQKIKVLTHSHVK